MERKARHAEAGGCREVPQKVWSNEAQIVPCVRPEHVHAEHLAS